MIKTGGADDPHYFTNIIPVLNTQTEPFIIGHPTAAKYHSTPFFVPNNVNLLRSPTSLSSSNTIGDKHDFWIESVYNNGDFIQREATLQAGVKIIRHKSSLTLTQIQAIGEQITQKYFIYAPKLQMKTWILLILH